MRRRPGRGRPSRARAPSPCPRRATPAGTSDDPRQEIHRRPAHHLYRINVQLSATCSCRARNRAPWLHVARSCSLSEGGAGLAEGFFGFADEAFDELAGGDQVVDGADALAGGHELAVRVDVDRRLVATEV